MPSRSNAFMNSVNKEKMAFAKAASGDPAYRSQEFCLRTKGMDCRCTRCMQNTSMSFRPGSRLSCRPSDFEPSTARDEEVPFDRVLNKTGDAKLDAKLDEMDAHAKAGRYESRTILQVGFKG